MATKKKTISKPKKAAGGKPAKKAPVKKTTAPKKAVNKAAAPKKAAKKASPASSAKGAVKKNAGKVSVAKKSVKKTPAKAVKSAPAKSSSKKPAVKKAAAVKAPVKKAVKAPKPVVKKATPQKKAVVAPPPVSVKKHTTVKPALPAVPKTVQPAPAPAPTPVVVKAEPVVTQRYSEKELVEFRALIHRKLDEAREELSNLQSQIISANENGTDDTGASFKMLEDGSEALAKEEAANLAARQKKFIEQLEAALVRIENKTYGICRITGKLIPKERLRAVPHTTQSMEAKLKQYRD